MSDKTKTDRELLELAAKAIGIKFYSIPDDGVGLCLGCGDQALWNPIRSHAQAKNLRHRLQLTTGFDPRWKDLGDCMYATYPTGEGSCDSIMQNIAEAGGKKAAYRRAVVRAAAAIGEGL